MKSHENSKDRSKKIEISKDCQKLIDIITRLLDLKERRIESEHIINILDRQY